MSRPSIRKAFSIPALIMPGMLAIQAATPVLAHHSFAKFALDTIIELEGEITEVNWRNPHISFTFKGGRPGEAEQTWHLETASPGILRRMGITADMVTMGQKILVAGNPAVNGSPELNARNLLMPDGRELVLGNDSLRFEGRRAGDGSAWGIVQGDTSRPELGLFRIWSSSFAIPNTMLFPDQGSGATLMDYPLTPTARIAAENFDIVAGSQRLANDCAPKGMPWIMEQPYDMMFERESDDILLKLEEFDVVRRIRMNFDGDRAGQPFSIHGFSTGSWDGTTLVVETTNLNSENFKFEIAASEQATIVERFTPTAAGDRLDYEIEYTDPVTFTETILLSKSWLSLPDQSFDAYNCGEIL